MVSEDLYRPFRSQRGRRVALVIGALQLVLFVAVAALLRAPFGWADRSALLAVGVAVAALLWRLGSVTARPSQTGLAVRNLFLTTTLDWAQIVAVRLGGGGPWVVLDLDDGDTLPVMAIQRADNELGRREAQRLATLVALHSRTPRDD